MIIALITTWLQEFEKEAGYMTGEIITEQEKIREGIAGRYCYATYGSLLSYMVNEFGKDDYRVESSYKFADGEMSSLHSQGVVIKVEGGLPESIMDAVNGNDNFGKREFARLLKNCAGCVAVEPLMEEEGSKFTPRDTSY